MRGLQPAISLPYFQRSSRATGNPANPMRQPGEDRCYHHKRDETSDHRPGPGHRLARGWPHGRPANYGPRTSLDGSAGCRQRGDSAERRADRRANFGPSISPDRPRRGPRRGRIFAPLSPRGWNPVAGSHRSLLSVAGNCFRASGLAHPVELGTRARPPHICGRGDRGAGISLPGREFLLARESPVSPRACLGSVHTSGVVAPGASFFEFKERGVTHTGCLLATSDAEIGKTDPGPQGCGANRAILHSRPRRWARHSLRTRLRLAEFSLATPSASVV